RWCGTSRRPKAVTEDALAELERVFAIALPRDYREQVLAVGLPSPTIELLDRIFDANAGVADLSELHSPEEVRSATLVWREAGLPETLLAIGSDCGGNTFAFDLGDLRGGPVDRAAVYFWDHEFGTVRRVARSFSAWVERFLRL
ncbi:MAG: SMI1/KNR4 family protein, partial [Pseudomonadota bacterium]